jgi:UPF0176 protein
MSFYTIVAFYKFTQLTNVFDLQTAIKKRCKERSILGTILVAEEGINGTIAGTEEDIKAIVDYFHTEPLISGLSCKYSVSEIKPFEKLKVYLKKEIVALHRPDINPYHQTGEFVSPEEWNQLISDPEVLVIDTRNTYETELGTFKGAIDPKTEHFRDFPNYVKAELDPEKHKKIAMFCTGGIRCEKASAYLLEQGFENVYQLDGGILKYLEKIEPENSLWEGKCFIFDERITLERETIIQIQ